MGAVSKTNFITKNFFFTGGTALSEFYFQHRYSEDIDFFSEKEFDSKRLSVVVSELNKRLKLKKVEQQSLTGQEVFYFYFNTQKYVKIDFSYFPFEHLGKFIKMNDLRVSSVEDITVNKLHAITTRQRKRDYYDLYLCTKHLEWRVNDLRKYYRLKFDIDMPIEQIATSFVNVVDATDEPIFTEKVNWQIIENYFLSKVKELKKDIISQ